MHNLSKRLTAILKKVNDQSSIIWDICCDHGQLGLALQTSHKKIYFLDQVKAITDKLKDSDIPSDSIFCEDARVFEFPKSDSAISYIICGIGGELSIEIIKNIKPILKANDQIVLSPHNSLLKVREYLSSIDIGCKSESIIKENNQFYEIFDLSLNYTDSVSRFPGHKWPSSDSAYEYIQQMSAHYEIKARYNNEYKEFLTHLKSLISAYNNSQNG